MRPRYHTKQPPRIQGFDTEARRGNLLVVCSPDGSHQFDNKHRYGKRRLLDWLWREARDTNFFYNLTYDRDVLLKPFARQMKGHSVSFGPYRIRLLGNKSFSLGNAGSHRHKEFYDISGFYSDDNGTKPLEEVARLFLGVGKVEGVDRERLGSEDGYYEVRRSEVIEYCKQDAKLAYDLGKLLVKTLQDALGFYPKRYNSKASISKAWAEVYHSELFERKQHWRWSLTRASYRGGIFLTRVLGRVENVSEIDISSAYGDALRRLPRLDRLERRVSKTYHPEARLGAYWILVDYDGRLPMDARLRNKKRGRVRITYPTSNGELRPYTASKAEIDYFVRTNRTFVVLMAEEWFGAYEPQFPELDGLLSKIAALKKQAESDPMAKVERMLFKTIVNALYGCLAESKYGETPLTCWPLAAEITGRTRVKIWDQWDSIEGWGGAVVSVNTDSLRFTFGQSGAITDLCTVYSLDHRAGDFESKFRGGTVTHYQSGIAIIEENGKSPLLRKRGKPLLTVKMLRTAKGPVLNVPSKHVTHIYEAIAQDRPDDIGMFDDPNDRADDTKIDLRSNLFALDFEEEQLTFERLNAGPVVGINPNFDDLAKMPPRRKGKAKRRAVETTAPISVVPETGFPPTKFSVHHTEPEFGAEGQLQVQALAQSRS